MEELSTVPPPPVFDDGHGRRFSAVYRRPSHSARSARRGSFSRSERVSNCIVSLWFRSYCAQPGSPHVAKLTQAACILSAVCWGGASPRSTSMPPIASVSKTNGISRAWHEPSCPSNAGDRQAHGLRNEIHFSNQVALDLASVHSEMVS